MSNITGDVAHKTVNTNSAQVIYLPGLNGLRAIAALGVVLSHITLKLSEFGLSTKIFGTDINGNSKGLDLGGTGVTIFFTLSGFLITFLLLKEKSNDAIKVKHFYLRRLLRIWPLYYLYFLLCVLTALVYNLKFEHALLPFYIFLTANIPFLIGNNIPFLHHYWSLAVEEQFYLFFPHFAKFSNKKLLKTSILIICILFSFKLFFWVLSKKYNITFPLLFLTVNRFHIMLIGAIGAILYFNKNRTFIFFTTHKITQIFSWICIFFLAINTTNFYGIIHEEFYAIITLFIIISQVTRKNYIINLENKLCNFIGKISYGIYVIHPLVIFYLSKIIGHFSTPTIFNYCIVFLSVISTTIILAYVSYEFYEKNFLKLKAKFTSIKSSNVSTIKVL